MAITEKQIRTALVAAVKAVCSDAKVFERNVLTGDRAKWAGLFTHEVSGTDVTHGWIIRRTGVAALESDPRYTLHTFEFLGFYGYNFGASDDNSEDVWQTILDNLRAFFPAENQLGLGNYGDLMQEGLQFPSVGLIRVGDSQFLHFAGGRMRVRVFEC